MAKGIKKGEYLEKVDNENGGLRIDLESEREEKGNQQKRRFLSSRRESVEKRKFRLVFYFDFYFFSIEGLTNEQVSRTALKRD